MSRPAPFDLDSRHDAREARESTQRETADQGANEDSAGDLVNDRYELVAEIARGESGTVWEALDLLTQERVALRRPARNLAGNPGWVYQFLRDAVVAMRFSSASPRFVTAFHVDQDDRGPFLLVEHVADPTLRRHLEDWASSGRPSPDHIGTLVGEIALALSELHASGMVYGELKPDDIFVVQSENGFRVRLTGFGLAENAVSLGPDPTFRPVPGRYASPEQADNLPVDFASDVFSLGMLAYECFSGLVPRGVFDPLSEVVDGIPGDWSDMVQASLAFRPERRPSIDTMVAAFLGKSRALVVVPAESDLVVEPAQSESDTEDETSSREPVAATPAPQPLAPSPRFAIASQRTGAIDLPELCAYLERMRSLPGGTFPVVDDRRATDGGRTIEVVVSAFAMGRHSVTVGMWREYCSSVGLEMPDAPEWGWIDDHPVVNVSWEDIAGRGGKGGYCGWASRQAGITLTLPTLAQREYASRECGKSLEWPWGLTFLEHSVWGSVNVVRDRTASVYRTENIHENSVGLVDMAGNVWDWCSDWFSPYESRPVPGRKRFFGGRDEVVLTDPKGRPRGDFKGMAGGSWSDYSPILFRCHGHIWDLPQYRSSSVGFRLVSPDA